ncbi:MAG: hypothetical protein J6X78_08890 [Treponema sp.]|nr:hypothetical protein [Treponema sp.]
MIPMREAPEKKFSLSYNFTSQEVAVLAKFLRDNEEKMPAGLELFYKALEDSVYKSLSLDEVKKFYS